MKAGRLAPIWICFDQRIITTAEGTSTHNVLIAYHQRELDSLITEKGWYRNNGFYYAPVEDAKDYQDFNQWVRREAPRPYPQVKQPFYKGFYVIDPEDQRRDMVLFTANQGRAESILKQLGWRKRGGGFSYGF